MNRKIIGIFIIFSGSLMFVGIVYFVFFSGYYGTGFSNEPETKELSAESLKLSSEEKDVTSENIKSEELERIIIEEVASDDNSGDNDNIQQTASKKTDKDELGRMASSFAERFGSYSNQSNFSNITGLKVFMSRSMQEWADNYINTKRQQGSDNSIYYGIATKAVGHEVKEFNENSGRVVILVKTRRREALNSTNNTSNIFSQDISVSFIKETGTWKVDGAVWQ